MKAFVKIISAVVLLFMSVTDLISIFLIVYDIGPTIEGVKTPAGGTLDGEPTPILDFIGQGFMAFVVVLLVAALIFVVAEFLLKIYLVYRAAKDGKYGFYLVFSIVGIIMAVISIPVILHVGMIASMVSLGSDWIENLLDSGLNAAILIDICSIILLIPVVICADKLSKNENS